MSELTTKALNALKAAGADQAACSITHGEATEMNFESGEMTLIRTVERVSISLTALVGKRKGTTSINQTADLEAAAAEVVAQARAAQDDDANDISQYEEGPTHFTDGSSGFDREKMHSRLEEFFAAVKAKYPQIVLIDGLCSYEQSICDMANSNGVQFRAEDGIYNFQSTFCAKDGERASSMNYTGGAFYDLDQPFMAWGGMDMLLEQTVRELEAGALGDKFMGDVVTMPLVTDELVQMYLSCFLRDGCLISGTSLLRNKMGQAVASPLVNLFANPDDPELLRQHITGDLYRAMPLEVMTAGVLKSFVLGLYGAKKTGLPCSRNGASNVRLTPGDTALDALIGGVKKGILLGRFSGGSPNDKGDITGVAKNSFLIEDGEVTRPLQETMIAGNLLDMLRDVQEISKDTLNTGYSAQPWVRIGGVTVSG